MLGLGTMLGKMMAESGGADQIAKALLGAFGKERVHWAMMFVAFIVGIPLFFEIGFVLLMPLVFIMARRVEMPLVKIAIPLLAGLSVVHGLVPPHPGPLLAISIFGADIGKTILYGLIVGLPTAIIAGPLFGSFISRFVVTQPTPELAAQLAHEPEAKTLPSVGITLLTVLLPVFLMLLKSFADVVIPEGHVARQWMDFIGDPIVALLAALLLSFFTFGLRPRLQHRAHPEVRRRQPGADRFDRPDHRRRRRLQADAGRHRRRQRHRPAGAAARRSRRSSSPGWPPA